MIDESHKRKRKDKRERRVSAVRTECYNGNTVNY